MADIAQVLATYDALLGVSLGAGLTYGFGALNRRHQEKRENDTRWYEARLQAHMELYQAAYDAYFIAHSGKPSSEVAGQLGQRVLNAVGTVHFVGSPEVIKAAEMLLDSVLEGLTSDGGTGDELHFLDALEQFQVSARNDLGHPSP